MRIHWTQGARQNLNQIEEYIAQDNPHAAMDTVFRIIKSVETLADHPTMGKIGRIFDTRELIIGGTPFIVPYRVKAGHLEILRVLHSAMRWPEIL